MQEGIFYEKEKTKKILIYVILSVLVVQAMVLELIKGDYFGVFLCLLTLLLFMIPSFVDKRLNIQLPSLLEDIILIFIFSAEILGEIAGFYQRVPYWDTILHTLNGFIMAGIGLALIDILNRTPSLHFNMSPVFVVVVAFCFSMTIGVIWEFFEFGMDYYTKTDMQKDTVYTDMSSVELNPYDENDAYIITDISQTVIKGKVDGKETEIVTKGYIDIGIRDTMEDLAVNCIGAVVFSVFGIFYLKGRSKLALGFIPKMKENKEDKE